MPAPELKRVNTLGIRLVEGRLTMEIYDKIIDDILGLDVDDLYGIGERNDYKFLLKLNTEEKYEEICNNFTASNISVAPGIVIEVNDISSYRTRIVVKDIPFELSEDMLKLILGEYGKVEKVNRYYNYRLRNSKYEKVKTDRVIVWMELDCSIPSSFYIKQSQTYVYAMYDNQPKTCLQCGVYGHMARNCNTRGDRRSNIIDLSEYNLHDEEEDDNVTVSGGDLPVYEPDQVDETNECEICDFRGNDQESLNEHVKTHTIETGAMIHIDPSQTSEGFKCTLCDYSCNYEETFKVHLETHPGEKPYPCSCCGERFATNEEVKLHLLTHSREMPYPCNHCGESFLANNDLQQHLLLHTKEKPYKCTECDESFLTNEVLQYHMSSHNKEKPHQCSQCEEVFATNEDLGKHLLSHSKTNNSNKKFQCTECDFFGKNKRSLKRHMKNHSGEFDISLACSKCDLTFLTEGELNMHEKYHSEETVIDASFAESVAGSFAEKVKSPTPKVVNQSTPKPKVQINGRNNIPSSQPSMGTVGSGPARGVQKRSLSISPEANASKKHAKENYLKSTSLRKPSARVQGMKL